MEISLLLQASLTAYTWSHFGALGAVSAVRVILAQTSRSRHWPV